MITRLGKKCVFVEPWYSEVSLFLILLAKFSIGQIFQRIQAECTCRDQHILSLTLEKVCPLQTCCVYTEERSFVHHKSLILSTCMWIDRNYELARLFGAISIIDLLLLRWVGIKIMVFYLVIYWNDTDFHSTLLIHWESNSSLNGVLLYLNSLYTGSTMEIVMLLFCFLIHLFFFYCSFLPFPPRLFFFSFMIQSWHEHKY